MEYHHMLDASSSDKLDIVIIILLVQLVLIIFGAIARTRQGYRSGEKLYNQVSTLRSQGLYQDAIELSEHYLGKRPNDSQLIWLQADCLYKNKQLDEALIQFKKLSEEEPAWKEDADKYIKSIESKT